MKSQAAAACDFVTVDTALGRRFYLLFFIDVVTRRVTFVGMTMNPTGAWTAQAARSLFITGAAKSGDPHRPVTTRQRCDGLIHEYKKAA